ncbi:TolC family protein [Bacteriovorax sp. PP10]|uniref:TolC family protein n=1 Tax=Bacteriovorax antarcticus TaxID=3088717 RepID=A0ABU5VRT0_9BACT|nr:TolC family protein [Bacteriovorax sp. PP10]MEA9355766.1 TolC family protein [Bacteriovorax sp. PP10]
MKKILSTFIITMILFSSTLSFAAETKTFIITPESIRTQMFSSNMTLLQALNNVEKSKLDVSMARAKLLPSLNLGLLIPALANPTFLLAQVSFLFPFLIPSNWAVLKQEKALLEADRLAYKALQLNILSNALSLYYTYLNDIQVQQIYSEQSTTLGLLYQSLKRQASVLGNVTTEDLNMAAAQWEESKIQVSKLQELLIEERAALRTLLGLPLGALYDVKLVELAPTDFELKSASEIAQRSLDVAPEMSQIGFLIKAAKAGKFAKVFGFISSATVSGSSTDGSSAFSGLKAGGGFTIGADTFVNVKIGNNNIAAIQLREDQLREENEKTAEIISGRIVEVKSQKDLTANALRDRLKVYEAQKKQYAIGLIPLQTLFLTQTQLTASYVNNIKNDLDLKMQRLTLQRLVIDGDFAKVVGCKSSDKSFDTSFETSNDKKWFKKDPKESTTTLDDICK